MNPCVQHGAETLEQACIKPNGQIDDPGNGHQWNDKIEGAMTYGEQPQGASSSQGPAERTKQLIGNGFAAVERAESCIAEARAQLASIYNDLSNIPVGPRSLGGSGPEDADAPFNTPMPGRAASLTDKTVQSQGLKEYSRAVCQKVKQKGRTTYAEVAEELVTERSGQHDDKNVRRRVYDALNVLMAAGMITKDRREIKWNSTGAVEDAQIEQLRTASLQWLDRVHRKQSHLQDLVEQYNRLLALLHRNWTQPQDTVSSNPLMLPFILIQACPQAVVEVRIAEDKGAAHLDFNDMPFQLRDEQHVLKNMQLPPLSSRADLCAPQPAPNGVAAMPRPATTAPPAAADTEPRLPAE